MAKIGAGRRNQAMPCRSRCAAGAKRFDNVPVPYPTVYRRVIYDVQNIALIATSLTAGGGQCRPRLNDMGRGIHPGSDFGRADFACDIAGGNERSWRNVRAPALNVQ